MIIARYKNEEDGIEGRVVANTNGGYNVLLWDTDADAAVPSVRIFRDLEAAKGYAKEIAKWGNTEIN